MSNAETKPIFYSSVVKIRILNLTSDNESHKIENSNAQFRRKLADRVIPYQGGINLVLSPPELWTSLGLIRNDEWLPIEAIKTFS